MFHACTPTFTRKNQRVARRSPQTVSPQKHCTPGETFFTFRVPPLESQTVVSRKKTRPTGIGLETILHNSRRRRDKIAKSASYNSRNENEKNEMKVEDLNSMSRLGISSPRGGGPSLAEGLGPHILHTISLSYTHDRILYRK